MLKKTKIITTWGPSITQKLFDVATLNDPNSSEKIATARKMASSILRAGANCVRLNFSHGTIEEQLIKVSFAKEASNNLNIPISIMCDTQGPELRMGTIENDQAQIMKNDTLTIFCRDMIVGNNTSFSISDSSHTYDMSKDIHNNDIILIDDGKLKLLVVSVDIDNGTVIAKALNNHIIKSKKRVNLPNITYTMNYMTDIDIMNITVACKNNFDYIAASFISSKNDLLEVRKIIEECGSTGKIKLIAKPESTTAIKNIDEIIDEADGVMVPRGDLGLEIPYYEVPYWERYIIERCHELGKPVIVATQMLDSMERFPIPTRAEVTDVFWAGSLGTDATMLSGETANGMFPIESVETMAKINTESEMLFNYQPLHKQFLFYRQPFNKLSFPTYAKKIAIKIYQETMPRGKNRDISFPIEFVVIFTNDEKIIKAISNIRPGANIIVITDDENIYTAYGIYYAILTYKVDDLEDAKKNNIEVAKNALKIYSGDLSKSRIFIKNNFIPFKK